MLKTTGGRQQNWAIDNCTEALSLSLQINYSAHLEERQRSRYTYIL
jgi:hypothetical protein